MNINTNMNEKKMFEIKLNKIIDFINLNNFKTNDEKPEDFACGYNPFSIQQLQSHNPVHSLFFNENTDEQQTLNHKYQIIDMNTVIDVKTKVMKNTPVFIKYSPLLDPLRYMIGKYDVNDENLRKLPAIMSTKNEDYNSKLTTVHNASYVDCFFSFLSSQVLHTYGFCHSIDYYGSYLGIQEKHKMNITDDYDYVMSSGFFKNNIGKLFMIFKENNEDEHNEHNSHTLSNCTNSSQKNRKRINLSASDIELEIEELCEEPSNNSINIETDEFNNFIELENIYEKNSVCSSVSCSSASSSSSLKSCKSEENDNNDEWETEDESECDDETEMDENQIYCYTNNFPVQMICLEKCDDTMDKLFMEDTMTLEIATSALFQVVMSLVLYQKMFQFTHNDLHTNNIMFVKTSATHLIYQFEGVKYKVPTYGRIFKIIDFGRSIYKFRGKLFCSDSFALHGDAHSQYNFEPFFNENKPRLVPNYSFDLCRLACSIYDFLIDDDITLDDMDELQKTIKGWCEDDNGKNILYKTNGEERFPNFKLYKMISRNVHHCVPKEQLNIPLFREFNYNDNHVVQLYTIDNEQIIFMNLDEMPECYSEH